MPRSEAAGQECTWRCCFPALTFPAPLAPERPSALPWPASMYPMEYCVASRASDIRSEPSLTAKEAPAGGVHVLFPLVLFHDCVPALSVHWHEASPAFFSAFAFLRYVVRPARGANHRDAGW